MDNENEPLNASSPHYLGFMLRFRLRPEINKGLSIVILKRIAIFRIAAAGAQSGQGYSERQRDLVWQNYLIAVFTVEMFAVQIMDLGRKAIKRAQIWARWIAERTVAFVLAMALVLGVSYSASGQELSPNSSTEMLTLRGHAGGLGSIAFSPNSRTIATGGARDCNIKHWDVTTGRELWAIQMPSCPQKKYEDEKDISALAFSPDGRMIASGFRDNLTLWDSVTGRVLWSFQLPLSTGGTYVYSIAFSHDGRKIAWGTDNDFIRIWDASTGRELIKFGDSYDWNIRSIAFSPDGKTLVSNDGGDATDYALRIWDVATGRVSRTLPGHSGSIEQVDFSPDGKTMLSTSRDYTMKIWDVASGHELRSMYFEFPGNNIKVAFSADGTTISASAQVWNASTGQVLRAWTPKSHPRNTVSPDRRFLASVRRDGSITLSYTGLDHRRVALVVANSAYLDAPLANPPVDANLVAASLERTGFSVIVKKDLDLDTFEQAILDFAEKARGADLALFYFAGHGFSVASGGQQQNLLMATSANFSAKTEQGLLGGGEPLSHVEESLIHRARTTLIFIDACRNIPILAGRGASGRGFARVDDDAAEGAYVVLSTRQGRIAKDGDSGKGSPFARAFASVMPTPGLRIEDAVALIRGKVRDETGGEQVPDVVRSDLPVGGVLLVNEATH